jgi:hypothetical protein
MNDEGIPDETGMGVEGRERQPRTPKEQGNRGAVKEH